jgi:hypothetical protein
MLNGTSYQEHLTDDPPSTAPTCPRTPYSAELLEVLAALEDELRLIVRQTAGIPDGSRPRDSER